MDFSGFNDKEGLTFFYVPSSMQAPTPIRCVELKVVASMLHLT